MTFSRRVVFPVPDRAMKETAFRGIYGIFG